MKKTVLLLQWQADHQLVCLQKYRHILLITTSCLLCYRQISFS